MARNPIVFSNGTLVSNAKVNVGGTIYDVEPAQYEGTTPLSASNMNQLQTNLYDYVDSKVIDEYSESTTDGYSANYVNGLNTYSTTETRIGTWIDGKPLYRKSYYISALANTGTTYTPLNITNLKDIISISGLASNGNTFFPLPAYRGTQDVAGIQLYADSTNGITITTGNDRTGYHANVIIEYTKTTD